MCCYHHRDWHPTHASHIRWNIYSEAQKFIAMIPQHKAGRSEIPYWVMPPSSATDGQRMGSGRKALSETNCLQLECPITSTAESRPWQTQSSPYRGGIALERDTFRKRGTALPSPCAYDRVGSRRLVWAVKGAPSCSCNRRSTFLCAFCSIQTGRYPLDSSPQGCTGAAAWRQRQSLESPSSSQHVSNCSRAVPGLFLARLL